MVKTLLIAVTALMGLVLNPKAHAVIPTAASGDLFIGFQDGTGAITKDYLIDLGNYANIASHPSINISSDLLSVFGSSWSNNVVYGVYGVLPSKTIYATADSATAGRVSPYPLQSSSTSATQLQDYNTLSSTYNIDRANGQTNAYGVWEGVSETGSWVSFTPNNGAFEDNDYDNITTSIGSNLDLFKQTNGSPSLVGDYVLSLGVSSGGILSIVAVPEPSSYALLAVGGFIALLALRKRETVRTS